MEIYLFPKLFDVARYFRFEFLGRRQTRTRATFELSVQFDSNICRVRFVYEIGLVSFDDIISCILAEKKLRYHSSGR